MGVTSSCNDSLSLKLCWVVNWEVGVKCSFHIYLRERNSVRHHCTFSINIFIQPLSYLMSLKWAITEQSVCIECKVTVCEITIISVVLFFFSAFQLNISTEPQGLLMSKTLIEVLIDDLERENCSIKALSLFFGRFWASMPWKSDFDKK